MTNIEHRTSDIERRTIPLRRFDVGRLMFGVRSFLFLFTIFFASFGFAQQPDEPATGEELAEQLRSMHPEADSEISGILRIDAPKRRLRIPVLSKTIAKENSWQMVYETLPTTNMPAEKLVVIHSQNAPNEYWHGKATTSDDPEKKFKLRLLKPMETAVPFAGSDFWLSELGFDFLHWPIQNKLAGEMRLGQACYVLESINPNAPVVMRVKSWVDKDSGGLLIAEGYDRNKKLIKEFSLAGSSFKKVNGQWQLRKMKIRSPKANSETILEFDLPEESKN